MRKVIRLNSRYGEIHKLIRIGEKNSHLFLFVPANNYYRIGFRDAEMNVLEFVDPSGGPFIKVGINLASYDNKKDLIVKSISRNNNNNIIVEFE